MDRTDASDQRARAGRRTHDPHTAERPPRRYNAARWRHPQIRIGTSGRHYPAGAGAWDGIFYPPRGRRHRPAGFDELEYYAQRFDTVEVNSTFYGVPRREVAAAWAGRTPADFAFSIKLHQQFTHPLDEPKFRLSIAQNFLPNVESFYYMRLHGRNARRWWRHERAEERYDYHYSAAELRPFRDAADAASRLVKRLYLYMNNHFAAQAVANAATLKEQLGLAVAGTYREALVRRYPELAGIVSTGTPAEPPLLPAAARR